MRVVIKAYKENDLPDGETISINLNSSGVCAFAACDIDILISMLTKAKEHAINAEVDDEPLELDFRL